jgi:hypothetical protein
MSSKKMTLSADGTAATVGDATLGDVFTTLFNSGEAVTGAYKYIQEGVLFVGGMAFQNYRMGFGLNPFASR